MLSAFNKGADHSPCEREKQSTNAQSACVSPFLLFLHSIVPLGCSALKGKVETEQFHVEWRPLACQESAFALSYLT